MSADQKITQPDFQEQSVLSGTETSSVQPDDAEKEAAKELLDRTLQAKELPQEVAREQNSPGSASEDTIIPVAGDTRNSLEKHASVQTGVSRLVFVSLSVILEVLALFWVIAYAVEGAQLISVGLRLLAILLVLRIYSKNKTSSMKMPWILLIMAFPIIGVTLYLLVGNSGSTGKMRLRFAVVDTKLYPKMPQNNQLIEDLKTTQPQLGNTVSYVKSFSGFPVYQNTDVTYYAEASKALEAQ